MKNIFFRKFQFFEKKLRRLSGLSDKNNFHAVLARASQVNRAIEVKKNLIEDLYALRNVFAHQDRGRYIAEVDQSALDSLKKIENLIDRPPQAGVIFKKEVFTIGLDDITENVISEMRKNTYTHVPVYDNKRRFKGILSETTIFNWFADSISQEGRADFYKKRIKDISPKYLFKENDIFEFVESSKSIFEILQLFNDALVQKRRLGVVLITESGKRNERPIGIVTAWDLVEVNKYLK